MFARKLDAKTMIIVKTSAEDFDPFLPLDMQEVVKLVHGSKVISITFTDDLIDNLRLAVNALERLKVELEAKGLLTSKEAKLEKLLSGSGDVSEPRGEGKVS